MGAGAEVYDAATDTWTAAPSMTTPRWFQAASVLDSGLLMTGGYDTVANTVLTSAELHTLSANGAPCANSGDCASGFCVGGVCADTP